jgi:hypothetical protein
VEEWISVKWQAVTAVCITRRLDLGDAETKSTLICAAPLQDNSLGDKHRNVSEHLRKPYRAPLKANVFYSALLYEKGTQIGNWISFLLQMRKGVALLGPLERANLSHWTNFGLSVHVITKCGVRCNTSTID